MIWALGTPAAVPDYVNADGYAVDEAFFDGHFPAAPLVPGAILVAQLAAHLEKSALSIGRLKRMKFIRPLLPETPFQITCSGGGSDWQARFTDADGPFAQARFQVVPISP
ncbi:MAG: hypothetical protein AAF409_13055 [Pseudomonadota bacterium]